MNKDGLHYSIEEIEQGGVGFGVTDEIRCR